MPGIVRPQPGAGGSIDPSVTFANEVAKQTGIDPRVVYAWTVAEGAYAPNGTGHFNFLNLRPYKPNQPGGDVGVAGISSGNFDQFKDLNSAIASSVARIKQPFLSGLLSPVLQASGNPHAQIEAIATSGWDAGHYRDASGTTGGRLAAIFSRLYGAKALGTKPETTALPAGGSGASSDQTNLPSPTDALSGAFAGVVQPLVDSAGYALTYTALVMFAIVLAVFGLLSLLGVRPSSVVKGAGAAAVAA